jgi:ATP-dependent Clp protease ATP-binding subunit ClpC
MKSKTWIWNPNRPLWSFLFLWPTWVWKTELVKALTNTFYEDKDALIKFDMSEYSDKTSVNKLIWSSAWYIWYEDGWLLTEKVRKKPYSVVLFDEIEKWDFDVYNLLLQILEEWMITDNKWKQINFKNTIIIMTSNIWSDEFNEKAASIWFDVSEEKENQILNDYSKEKEKIKAWLTNFFLPEFINRIDKVVIFNPLDKNKIKKIVNLQIKDLEIRLNHKNIELVLDNKVINFITKSVYNPEFWAREIRRFINDYVEDIIAEKLVNNQNKKIFELYIENNKLKIK